MPGRRDSPGKRRTCRWVNFERDSRVSFELDLTPVARALGSVARARNMTALAREVGMSRVGLNKALSGEENPTLATVLKAAKALGLGISFRPQPAKGAS
ncbi:MAG: putative addiction module antidote protein [Rhodobacteraceae bacterium]|nr:putative addiction module antidote protein [Paracoccaceae bacterium]MCY4140510.1 putative addiction module antidote protein [Paracoccaceae bacterium]